MTKFTGRTGHQEVLTLHPGQSPEELVGELPEVEEVFNFI
jgi:hypothetical protein